MPTPNKAADQSKGHRSRVREKFARLGSFESFDTYEVLELLLFYAIPRKDTKPIAKNLIKTFGSLKCVLEADVNTLIKQPGIGVSAAVFLHSFSQVYSYISQETAESIRGSGDLGAFAAQLMKGKSAEEVYAIALSPKNEILNHRRISVGSFSSVPLNIREIINFAIESNVEFLALVHNHPNGMLTPSYQDVELTKKLVSVLKSLNITLVDHFITHEDEYFSFADSKLIEEKKK